MDESLHLQKTMSAKIISAHKLKECTYVKSEGWEPNFLRTPGGRKIIRVNLIGIVTSKYIDSERRCRTIMIDDTTDSVRLCIFNDEHKIFRGISKDDTVLIIGKPRMHNGEIYIVPDIIKKQKEDKWVKLRKVQLRLDHLNSRKSVSKKETVVIHKEDYLPRNISKEEKGDIKEKYAKLVGELDKGNGVATDYLINLINEERSERDGKAIVKIMLALGLLFEVSSGRVKIL